MSIGINSSTNAVNAYKSTANQKSGNEKSPTLEQLQEIVQNSTKLNTDLIEITLLSDTQMEQYITESNGLSNKYGQFFGSTFNVDDTISLYEQGRADLIKTYGESGVISTAHLNAFDKAFENKMGDIANKVAGDLAFDRFTREQEAIYIPKYINQLEQWYKDAVKKGDAKSMSVLSAELERMGARLSNPDTNKLAMHSDFNEAEFKTNMANMMGEYAKAIAQNFKSGTDAVSTQKTAFELMLATFNKTTSVNNLSFNDFMVVYKHSDYVAFVADKPTPITEAMRNENNSAFNNSTEISAELRALLK